METWKEDLLQFHGSKEETKWLREKLETMSAREELILAAALQRQAPKNAADMIRRVQSVPYHEVCAGADSHFALGQFFMEHENAVRLPRGVVAFVYMDKLGERYEAEYPGVFIGNNYVQYPQKGMTVPQYDGVHLPPKDFGWSLRLRLASAAKPEGVWICLPDYDDINGDRPGEIEIAFNELEVEHNGECTLLDVKCVLPNITDLMGYSDLSDLIYDGQNLGILMDERGQGQPDYIQRLLAALELEGCNSLRGAIDIADNLNRYELVPAGELESYGRKLLRNAEGTVLDGCIDLASYWRDTLPVDAVRLEKIVTGTYNVQGNYKIVYKTNLSGNSYRTLADNLNTQVNNVLDASPAALGLGSNEYVTEFMVSFGVVPGNFRQVQPPQVYCTVLPNLVGGAQFVNTADVGGVYNGQWIMAVTRWVTSVYKPAPTKSSTLPRTGY